LHGDPGGRYFDIALVCSVASRSFAPRRASRLDADEGAPAKSDLSGSFTAIGHVWCDRRQQHAAPKHQSSGQMRLDAQRLNLVFKSGVAPIACDMPRLSEK
jgi:hypothetical protein